MGFTVVRYEENQTSSWGVVKGDKVIPVSGTYNSLAAFLKEGVDKAREIAVSDIITGISINNLQILSPVTRPAQVICQGLNYASHRAEAGSSGKPTFNLIFSKSESALSGPYDDVIRPDHVRFLDYEIELGLVIKIEITQSIEITEDNLFEYVAGLVITNDISARDIQIPQDLFKGKSYRTFCPVGPYLYILDKDDIPQISNLELKLWVNGELRQSANTEQFIFKPWETLTEISGLMDLSPGDLIMTGTPGGVAVRLSKELTQEMSEFPERSTEIFRDNQKDSVLYLKDGDQIRSEIKSTDGLIYLGFQENLIVGIFSNQ